MKSMWDKARRGREKLLQKSVANLVRITGATVVRIVAYLLRFLPLFWVKALCTIPGEKLDEMMRRITSISPRVLSVLQILQ